MDCDYCGDEGIHTDCLGRACCHLCWEEGQKDWTLEKQAALDKLSKEVCDRLDIEIPKIKAENGLPPDYKGPICTRCRKPVQSDEHGNWYCDCLDERVGIDPNDPSVVIIPERLLRKGEKYDQFKVT